MNVYIKRLYVAGASARAAALPHIKSRCEAHPRLEMAERSQIIPQTRSSFTIAYPSTNIRWESTQRLATAVQLINTPPCSRACTAVPIRPHAPVIVENHTFIYITGMRMHIKCIEHHCVLNIVHLLCICIWFMWFFRSAPLFSQPPTHLYSPRWKKRQTA